MNSVVILRRTHLQLHDRAWSCTFLHIRYACERRLRFSKIGFSTSGHKSSGRSYLVHEEGEWRARSIESWWIASAELAGLQAGNLDVPVTQDPYLLKAIAPVLCCPADGATPSC